MKKKILSITWPFVGFIMLAYNFYLLSQIYKQPEISIPQLNELKSKLSSFTLIYSKQKSIVEEKKELFKKFTSLSEHKAQKKEKVTSYIKEEITLPVVQGILKSIDQKGKLHKLVMIDGKAYSEKQKVRDFIIEEILDNGVYLTRDGKKWFVKIPDVKFSIINE